MVQPPPAQGAVAFALLRGNPQGEASLLCCGFGRESTAMRKRNLRSDVEAQSESLFARSQVLARKRLKKTGKRLRRDWLPGIRDRKA